MPDTRAQRALRCVRCRPRYRHTPSLKLISPPEGWGGYEWACDPPRVRDSGKTNRNSRETSVRCRDCGHEWWTVDRGVVSRALRVLNQKILGY